MCTLIHPFPLPCYRNSPCDVSTDNNNVNIAPDEVPIFYLPNQYTYPFRNNAGGVKKRSQTNNNPKVWTPLVLSKHETYIGSKSLAHLVG